MNSSVKQHALTTVSASALLIALTAGGAQAQTPAPAQAAQAPGAVEEIIVTGTRVQRDGYEAPTPLTVIGIEQIEAAAPTNIAEFVNSMPQISGSATPQTSNSSISSGTAGLNTLNLRNLGSTRTLVLLDGQRSVGSTLENIVDVNTFPQALISRVDVVTGGASAAYGSDALSGVVNFVLDKKFQGVKGEVSGGVTTYGDDRSWKVSMTTGQSFAGDRGHFLLSGEIIAKDGIFGNNRAWNNTGTYTIVNPAYTATNGQPHFIVVSGAQPDTATRGGIITSTALKGIAFGAGGTPYQFNYGAATLDPWTVGGNWQANQLNNEGTLDGAEKRQGVFTRFAYDVTDNVNIYVQASWNNVRVTQNSAPAYQLGNLTIKADNAFLPANVAAQAAALKITQFGMGKFLSDLPTRGTDNKRRVQRYVIGGEGKFEAFDNTWSWNAYYQKGVTLASETLPMITNNASLASAIDAVRAPNGSIVCRSNLTGGNPACVPLNIFGTGVASQAAINYVIGTPHRNEDFKEDVQAVSITGEPFTTWAGPVSLATGVEHRREAVSGYVPPGYASGWNVGNYLVTTGAYEVTEGFVETVIPLAKDQVWAKAFDLNAAVRATGYSTSGYVTTWKVGASWNLIDDIRFRATRSRDIRAPNLQELFANGASNTNTVQDRFNNNAVTSYVGFTVGNPNLVPEKADTTGLGVVIQPQFFPGFQASFDYYNIDVDGTIDTVSAQNIVDLCFAGRQEYCSAITRGVGSGGAAIFSRILIQPFNFVTKTNRGYDIEASYNTRLDNINDSWGGTVGLRVLATHFLKNYTNTGLVPPTDTVGSVGLSTSIPNWRYTINLTYSNDPVSFSLTGRGFTGGNTNNSYVECASGCRATSSFAETINNNHMNGAFYWDANISYKIPTGEAGETQLFLTVRNLTNKDPEIFAQGPAGVGFLTQASNPTLYDQLGRVFRAGVRFKM
ncbi:MAG: TonB-dependent receptor domain-containing protein [Rhodospirillaceae bacterium]